MRHYLFSLREDANHYTLYLLSICQTDAAICCQVLDVLRRYIMCSQAAFVSLKAAKTMKVAKVMQATNSKAAETTEVSKINRVPKVMKAIMAKRKQGSKIAKEHACRIACLQTLLG